VFHSEARHGRKSYLSNLGNLAFNAPEILGAAARRARLSCASCPVNGASNPRLFIPGLSSRSGNIRYHERRVQSPDRRWRAGCRDDPEPARRTLSGSVRS